MMDGRIELTEGDLIEALLAARTGPASKIAITTREMQRRTGISLENIRKRLRALQDSGLLTTVYVREKSIDGRSILVPAYHLREQEDEMA